MRFSQADSRVIEKCIRELEARTRAEVVLVIRPASSRYRDIDYLFAALISFLFLCGILFVPYEIPESAIPLPMLLIFLCSAWLSRYSNLKRWLVPSSRKRQETRDEAYKVFYEKRIHRTASKLGILVYLSILEREADIVVDTGVEGILPEERLAEFRGMIRTAWAEKKPARKIGEFLRSFGVFLGRALPRDPDFSGPVGGELPDLPDIQTSGKR